MTTKDEETLFACAARQAIRLAMDEMGMKPRDLYVLLYGREPEGNEAQTFRNRLNRGNPSAGFIGLCVMKMPPLRTMAMEAFFSICADSKNGAV